MIDLIHANETETRFSPAWMPVIRNPCSTRTRLHVCAGLSSGDNMPHQRKYNNETVQKMIEMRNERRASLSEIGREFGCTWNHVRKIFKRNKISTERLHPFDKEMIDLMIRRYNEGATTYQLESEFGSQHDIIARALKNAGVEVKRKRLPIPVFRICSDCRIEKPISEFPKDINEVGRHKYRCKMCCRKAFSLWQIKRYGITKKDYLTILEKQKGTCAVCGRKETRKLRGTIVRFSVDHNHLTGKVRGLLCNRCNRGIGMFDDNIAIILNAVEYLKKDKTNE